MGIDVRDIDSEALLELAAAVAGEHRLRDALDTLVGGLAKQRSVALARVWLRELGCSQCSLATECQYFQCLHLAASAGTANDGIENWSFVKIHTQQCPSTKPNLATTGTTGRPILLTDTVIENHWIADLDSIRRKGIRSFVGQPLAYRRKIIGALAVFSHLILREEDAVLLKYFADQVAVAITNVQLAEERDRLLEELRNREATHRSLIDDFPEAIFTIEQSGKFRSANKGGRDLLGCRAEDITLLSIDDTYPEVQKVNFLETPETAMIGPSRFERKFLRGDGKEIPVEVTLSPELPSGRQIVIRDISASKRSEAALVERYRILQQVVENLPHQIVLVHAQFDGGYRNRIAREYLGDVMPTSSAECIKRHIHPDDADRCRKWIQNLIDGHIAEIEHRIKGLNGQYRWFLQTATPVTTDNGEVLHWCLVQVDIEDRKGAQGSDKQLQEENVAMFESIIGNSSGLRETLNRVSRVAKTDSTVLVTGETGTGKELIARAIHNSSARAAHPFVSVNCAAIPRELITSELFGHEKGAFTGALKRRLGRFELAGRGTIFLDEIGELPPETQVILLRVLQEREFQRVGGNLSLKTDARVIAATHRDLPAAIAAGTFRADLFYRINVFPIHVPPLRERKEDIPLLAEHFIHRFATKMAKKINRIDANSLHQIQQHSWPGNIRELQNVIERSIIIGDTDEFILDETCVLRQTPTRALPSELVDQERNIIETALAESVGRVYGPSGAAAKLGIPPSTLDSKIKTLKIDKRRFAASA